MSTTTAKKGEIVPVGEIEKMAQQYTLAVLEGQGRFQRALTLAQGIEALRGAITPYLAQLLPLQNSPLGFLTDKRDGYAPEVVRECLIEAFLRGVYPVGNEINIIASRCYITKNGYARLVRELPGLTDLKLQPGVPRVAQGGAVVPFAASWKLNGKAFSMHREIPVRINQGMGADAILGKATRKALAAIYAEVTGSEHGPEDGEVGDGDRPPLLANAASLPGASRTEQLEQKLAAANGGTAGKRQLSEIDGLVKHLEMDQAEFLAWLHGEFGTDDQARLTYEQAEAVIADLRGRVQRPAAQE